MATSTPALNKSTSSKSFDALDPAFASKLRAVFAALEAQGWQPAIGSGWRSIDEQAKLKAEGKSQVSFSFHNAVNGAGQPAALAVDVIDKRIGWKATDQGAAFFKALGASAKAHGLHWGGDFSQSNPVWAKFGMGWDPAHVQAYANSALGEVRKQSQAIWAALKGGSATAIMLPGLAATGWFEIMRRLPWWYWAGLGALGLLTVIILSRGRRPKSAQV